MKGTVPGTRAVRDERQSEKSTKIFTEIHENFHFCENLCPHKNLSVNIHGSFTDHRWKLETTRMSFHEEWANSHGASRVTGDPWYTVR